MAKTSINPIIKTLIWPIVVLIIAFGVLYIRPWQQKPTQSISVSATGTATATPNVAKITATFESKNQNIDKAREETNQKVSTVVEKLKAAGIAEKDIKTNNLSGGQAYETLRYPAPNRPTTNQFQISLEITIRNFDKADQIVQLLTENGAANLYGPNLTVDNANLEKAKSAAREDAVSNAKQKAKELAGASDSKVGKVIKIAEQGDYNYPQPMYAVGGADLKEKAATVQPGQDKVTITLTVEFSLN